MRTPLGIIALSIIGVLASLTSSFAADGSDAHQQLTDWKEQIDQQIEAAIAEGNLPGAVVGVWRDGQWILRKCYGQRSCEPAEAMTLDTVFDMASITKPVATATSVMLLVQDGRLDLNARVRDYLPEFTGQGRDEVRVWHLLTHSAGLIPDNALADYQSGPEEAWRKLMKMEIKSTPGEKFAYSDVGFVLLGRIVEAISEMSLKEFSEQRVFTPLGMVDSGYLPGEDLLPRVAPTEPRDGEMLRGEVHDPRAALLGGVAGHAGLFSTLDDMARYAQMMLAGGRLEDGQAFLRSETLWHMTRPYSIEVRKEFGPVTRTRGWDQHSPYSYNGGKQLSPSAFGHGGFTGTVLWIDPDKNLFFIFLSNRLHPDGKGSVNQLAGRIATLAVAASETSSASGSSDQPQEARAQETKTQAAAADEGQGTDREGHRKVASPVLSGIDVLAARGFRDLKGKRVGLVTNQTGIDRQGRTTLSLLAAAPDVKLVALFSPEHGIEGKLDVHKISDSRDARLDVPIYSLYGDQRRPTAEQLSEIDVLVYDIQDIGARFYTYIATLKNCLDACSEHDKEVLVLDRPNPIGDRVAGPVRDSDRETFVACHELPVQHGMTVGELALLFQREGIEKVRLSVVPVRNWAHHQRFEETGLWWINPSPNMRTLEAAMLYPGIGLLEMTNISVGRGTDRPFQWIGAPWLDGQQLADWLNSQDLHGVRCLPRKLTPDSSKHAHAECSGVQFIITDADALDAIELGLSVAEGLHKFHRDAWEDERLDVLLVNKEMAQAIHEGATYEELKPRIESGLESFRKRRAGVLLYD